jgi:hypothetical protein
MKDAKNVAFADFKKKFPNLAKEIQDAGFPIKGIRSTVEEAEKACVHDPGVIDFLRRCNTEDEGLEIIEYLKARGEIGEAYANHLKVQLLRDGIKSFGPKKERGYYLKFIKERI